jgi:predicted component of type VI protein secretion system
MGGDVTRNGTGGDYKACHWTEDLFLRPQRLQQADRDLENALESRAKFSETRAIRADRPELRIEFWPAGKIGDDDERG